jgi:hypothetical protein
MIFTPMIVGSFARFWRHAADPVGSFARFLILSADPAGSFARFVAVVISRMTAILAGVGSFALFSWAPMRSPAGGDQLETHDAFSNGFTHAAGSEIKASRSTRLHALLDLCLRESSDS